MTFEKQLVTCIIQEQHKQISKLHPTRKYVWDVVTYDHLKDDAQWYLCYDWTNYSISPQLRPNWYWIKVERAVKPMSRWKFLPDKETQQNTFMTPAILEFSFLHIFVVSEWEKWFTLTSRRKTLIEIHHLTLFTTSIHLSYISFLSFYHYCGIIDISFG